MNVFFAPFSFFYVLENFVMSPVSIEARHSGLTPYLVCAGADNAIAFYEKAFSARESTRYEAQGKVMHAELKIGSGELWLAEEMRDYGALAPQEGETQSISLHIYVECVDSVYEKALKAGAIAEAPPADMFWGDRVARVKDPFGHHWTIATHQREVSFEEIAQAMQ